MEDPEANCGAAAETARWRNFAGDVAGERERFRRSSFKKRIRRGTDHRGQTLAAPAQYRDFVVNPQRDAEAIKTGAEIGCARRNTDGNLLHDWVWRDSW